MVRWSDDECVKYFQTFISDPLIIFIAEHIVPGPQKPHFSKLFDIHMMCVATGKERTTKEYADLLKRAGWRTAKTLFSHSGQMGVILAGK